MKFLSFAFNILSSTGVLSSIVSSFVKKREYKSALADLFETNKSMFSFLTIFNIGQVFFWGFLLMISTGFLYNFSLLSASWALINSILFILAYYQSRKSRDELISTSFNDDFKKITSIQNIFSFNVGLDILYCAVGYFIIDKMQTIELDAFGAAVILQGVLLLLTDIVLLAVNRKKVSEILMQSE